MSVRVLVVDDSSFFRRRVSEMLNADPRLDVVGAAVDGRDAIQKTKELKPDVITMDIEMPVMDGITAVRRIMAEQPTPILMFSSLTQEGAQSTFEALEAGAVDYIPKNFDDISNNRDEVAKVLRSRVWTVGVRGQRKRTRPASASTAAKPATSAALKPAGTTAATPPVRRATIRKGTFNLVAIGTSTGGPVALQEVLTKIPQNFSLPIVLVQHMPGSFTTAFANRLNSLCKINVKEAQNGDVLQPGTAFLAPGGKQMLLEGRGDVMRIKIMESEPGQNYKPCVDVTFSSIANSNSGKTLAVILTGMGADGREGARELKKGGSTIWAQDEETSVIYGMPMAVAQAGLADQVLPLPEIGPQIATAG